MNSINKAKRRSWSSAVLAFSVAASIAASATPGRAATIFSDNFSTSVINATATPTASSAGYVIVASKNQSPAASIGTGHLDVGIASTSSGIEQLQTQFTTAPVTLATANDSIDLTVTFTNTSGILTGAGTLYFGLYNSGGSAPLTGLDAAGLSSSLTTAATGGVQNWQGYVAQHAFTGGNSRIVTRPMQSTGADNTDQDLVSNAASSSQSYHSPASANLVSSTTPDVALTAGNQYTEDFNITLTGLDTYTLTSNLYAGGSATGTPVSTQTATATDPNFFNSFDGLAVGWRETGSQATAMDLNSISVTDGIGSPVPEPASLGMLVLGGAALLMRRRRA
jgi:hypothetical protein